MFIRRTTGSKQTVVRHADKRVAGEYEPTQKCPAPHSAYSAYSAYDQMAASAGTTEQLVCSGRLGTERTFDYASLVRSSRQLSGGRFGVAMIDILAAVGLDRSADVIVFSDRGLSSDGDVSPDGVQLAVPVRDLMIDGAIVLGTVHGPLEKHQSQPFLLDVPGWTDNELQIVPRSLRAVSFAEFLQCS